MRNSLQEVLDHKHIIHELEERKKSYQFVIDTIESSIGRDEPGRPDIKFGKKLAISLVEGMIMGCDTTIGIINKKQI